MPTRETAPDDRLSALSGPMSVTWVLREITSSTGSVHPSLLYIIPSSMSNESPAKANPTKERKVHYMDAAHVQDFSNLHLGHPAASKRTVGLLDLFVNVFGLDEIAGSSLPISLIVCYMLAFTCSSLTLDPIAWLGEQGLAAGWNGQRHHRRGCTSGPRREAAQDKGRIGGITRALPPGSGGEDIRLSLRTSATMDSGEPTRMGCDLRAIHRGCKCAGAIRRSQTDDRMHMAVQLSESQSRARLIIRGRQARPPTDHGRPSGFPIPSRRTYRHRLHECRRVLGR